MKRLSGLVLLLLLCSCASADRSWLDAPHGPSRFMSLVPGHGESVTEIERALRKQKHSAALVLLKKHTKRGKIPQRLHQTWTRTLNLSSDAADQLLRRSDFVTAGLLYRQMLDLIPPGTPPDPELRLGRAPLQNRIEQCADLLLEQGLQAYREGDLQLALEIWNRILRFHPHHQASQNAIRTTRMQLQNLESLPASS